MSGRPFALLAMLTLLGGRVGLAQSPAADGTAMKSTTPVTAVIRAGDREREVTIVSRNDAEILFQESSGGLRTRLPIGRIQLVSFRFSIDYGKLVDATQARNWLLAARLLLGPLKPTLPYLDLPENNAVDLVIQAGDMMMRSAEAALMDAQTDAQEAKARKQYEGAYALLKYATTAEWGSAADVARLKRIRCLLAMDKASAGRRYMERLAVPVPGDRAYGLYWLVQAELEMERGEFRAGMDAAVKSLCFENKDIDTFPDALLASARCYEELQEWHRARDVYYEVARIFPASGWADLAVRRLRFIMKKELTKADDTSPIESVFFGFKEDMDAKVEALFEAVEEEKRNRLLSGGASRRDDEEVEDAPPEPEKKDEFE